MADGDTTVLVNPLEARRAAIFDGVNDKLRNGTNFRAADQTGTISAWVKADTLGTVMTIFGSLDEGGAATEIFELTKNASNKIQITTRINSSGTIPQVEGDTALVADTWYHVALSSDGSSWKIYLDGSPMSLTILAATNDGSWLGDIPNRDSVTIGVRKQSTEVQFWDGAISDVAYWDRQLTDAEVLSLSKRAPIPSGSLNRWKLDDDYTDSVGSLDMTNTGTYLAIQDDLATRGIAALRVNATDEWKMASDGEDLYLVHVEKST